MNLQYITYICFRLSNQQLDILNIQTIYREITNKQMLAYINLCMDDIQKITDYPNLAATLLLNTITLAFPILYFDLRIIYRFLQSQNFYIKTQKQIISQTAIQKFQFLSVFTILLPFLKQSTNLFQIYSQFFTLQQLSMTKYSKLLLLTLIFFLSFTSQQSNQPSSDQNAQLVQQCQIKCEGVQLCISSCLKDGGRDKNVDQFIGLVVGISIAFIFIMLTTLFVCLKPCIWCPNHFYSRFKRKYNIVDCQGITESAFREQANKILFFLQPRNKKSEFYMWIDGKQYRSIIKKLMILKQKSFLVDFDIQGADDRIGNWKAKGSIVQKKNGIKFWMYKMYKKDIKNNKKLHNFGKDSSIIMKSKSIKQEKGMKGIWQCCQVQVVKEQNKKSRKSFVRQGRWEINMKDGQAISLSQQVIQCR